jgi:4-aminobutyrate aminotransferase-like enzyme
VLGDVLAARLATIVTLSAWRAAEHPNNADYLSAWDGASWNILRQLDALGYDGVATELGADVLPESAKESFIARRNTLFSAAQTPLSYDEAVFPVSGRGATLTEADGKVLIDAYNNIPSVGYAHPRVSRAIADQVRTLSTNLRYVHPRVVELGERILESMPVAARLDTVLFVNSGSEANDVAWRIAQAATAREGALVTERAFHGMSMAGMELSPGEWLKTVKTNRVARFTPGGMIHEAIAELARHDVAPAALFVDPVYGSDGILAFGLDDHAALSAATRQAGARLIVDEVQAGYGRTGEHLWSFAAVGLQPDIVTLGKPAGNGYPLAAVVARSSDVEALGQQASFFSSFAGSPVAAVAGLAVLDVIRDEDLVMR